MQDERTPWTDQDIQYMNMALKQASEAATASDDVPVGAVIVDTATGEVVAVGHNTREAHQTAIGHAEIQAIEQACGQKGNWRLSDCTLYVTLEPCPMCAGAILHARIPRVVCGAKDPVAGAMGSVWSLHKHPTQKSTTTVEYGCCEPACREMLQTFFKKKRN